MDEITADISTVPPPKLNTMSMSDSQNIRVLVVDDSAFMRSAIGRMIREADGLDLVGSARDGLEGIGLAEKLKPDVVTLDIEMPVMDGLTALKQIRRVCGAAVLMVSSLTTEGSHATLRALQMGAADFIAKGQSQICTSIVEMESELIGKIRAVAPCASEGCDKSSTRSKTTQRATEDTPPRLRSEQFTLVVVGSSTGGPPALEALLKDLPADFPLPIVIAQHMPSAFTQTLSDRLDGLSKVRVLHAEGQHALQAGHVYVIPGGQNNFVRRRADGAMLLQASNEATTWPYKPSVNLLFSSATAAARGRVLGIMLTGMGEDGLNGSRELRAAGGTLLAQDHASCVVYGMPKAITQAGLTQASLNPELLSVCLKSMTRPAVSV